MPEDNHFTKLYSEHEHGLHVFIFSLLPNKAMAEEVTQETMVKLWENMDKYDASRPFFPWACRFAYRQVLMHRRNEANRRRLFCNTTLELLAEEKRPGIEWEESRLAALRECLQSLTDQQRFLIRQRYNTDVTLVELAESLGQKVTCLSACSSGWASKQSVLEAATRPCEDWS